MKAGTCHQPSSGNIPAVDANNKSEELPNFDGYDYFDFGCSTGGNIEFTKALLPHLRGLGVDIDNNKIQRARANGHDAIIANILDIPAEKKVGFVSMAHFLEHLSSVGDARAIIGKAISVSRNFVLIRQPWFDSDGELLQVGLKFFWSHWRGHRNKMTTLDFYSLLAAEVQKKTIKGFSIYGRREVKDSTHAALIPLTSPIDQFKYDSALHGAKEAFPLPFSSYEEIIVKIDLDHSAEADILMAKLAPTHPIFCATDK